jgi:predicted TIM-barrel fold metal-dependent hydrolase
MTYSKNLLYIFLFSLPVLLPSCTHTKKANSVPQTAGAFYSVNDFAAIDKFDTHVHLNTSDTFYIEQAKKDNMRLLDIVDDRPFGIPMAEQEKIALQQIKAFPGRVVYATTFSVGTFNTNDWQQQTIAKIKNAVLDGAIAVKIWKNVGMDLKDTNGNFVMIDNPKLDPVLDYLAKNNIPLIAHLAEPKECWMPLEQMVLHKGYYSEHPEYHMYLHPEYPSYETHMKARDHMLEKHPDLKFINAHLGSLEWSLEELSKRLDKFPNMAVDLARMPELFLHAKNDWQKTRNFFIKYQDRLLYATDVQVAQTNDPAVMKERSHNSKIRYWTFFTTDEIMNEPNNIGEFKGLKLPREVVDKIYRKNAERWLPGIAAMSDKKLQHNN